MSKRLCKYEERACLFSELFPAPPGCQEEVWKFAPTCFFFPLAALGLPWGFSGGSVGKNPPANAGDVAGCLGWEDALEEDMATHSSTLAWEIPGGAWWATVHEVAKSQTQLSD